jgi:flotillin
MELLIGFGTAGVGMVVFIMVLFAVVKSFLYIGRPNEVLIFSGRDHALPGGQVVGYRYKIGGRTLKYPILETVEQMDLRVIPVNIRIQGAYSKGGIPLNVHAIANIKISSESDKIHNAIERFLGVERSEVMRVAQETLEGNLRGVLATLTPEDVNENRLRFVEELQKDVEPDFEKLGLHLDTLKIQNVSDDRDYLDSIGRKRIAEIVKQAEIAESNAMKEAEEIEAHEQGRSEVARRQAQAQIQKSQNELRELIADLELKAKSEEEKSEARALATRAESEQELQKVRTDLEAIRLQADVVIPAEADKVARELLAAGEAAEIAEKGRAMAEVLRMMTEVWAEAGEAAMDIFLIQRMESIMGQVAEAARQVQVREVALIDSGDGTALPNYVSAFPRIVGSVFTDLRDIVGVDIGKVLRGDQLEMAERLMAEVESRASLEDSGGPKALTSSTAAPGAETKPSFSALKQRISNKPSDGSEG